MLIRMVLALANRELEDAMVREITASDIEVEGVGSHQDAWQRVVQSCADIIVISDALFSGPVDAGIGILTALPESPTVVVLHGSDSTDMQADLIAAGAHSAL